MSGRVEHESGACAEVDCEEVLRQLERFLDGEVDADTVLDVREHLAACYPCAGRVEFERKFRLLLRARCGDEPAPPGLVDRIRSCLDDADLTGSGG